MKTIEIKTQAELDALPDSFKEYTVIKIDGGTSDDRIVIKKARGSSHVEARDSSHVVARGSSGIHNHSGFTTLEIFGFVAVWMIAKTANLTRTGENTTVIEPKRQKGNDGWLDDEAVPVKKGLVIVFKRVSKELKTQEKTVNETTWSLGATLEHAAWAPKGEECGADKFHACSRPYFCDEFRSEKGDRYVAIEVATKDLHAWEGATYPHKIAFRRGKVLFECDRYGKELKTS